MGSKNKNRKSKSESMDGEKADGGNRWKGKKVITDPRFASVHSDPRFQEAPKHKTKVTIDSRFDRVFTDKRFVSSSAIIDKRGKVKKDTSNSLKHYYRMEESDFEEEEKDELNREDMLDHEDSEEEVEREEENARDSWALKTSGLGRAESESNEESGQSKTDDSEEEDSKDKESYSSSTADSDEDEVFSDEDDTFLPQEENVPEIEKETHRLAVVNMDWNQVKADDLYVVLSSFLPKGGQILSISVYPSEFGIQRMEEEAVRGPVGLFDDKKEKKESDDDDDDDDDDDNEIDNEKLRAYEQSRLRYYFAVVNCDSVSTADYLYKTCDGVEFERSSNKLDLRFIPDSMEFKHPPRDVATEAPTNYDGLDYHTQALQHSKIRLTWDEDQPHRSKTLKRKFNAEQLAELELKEFLASDESESEEDDCAAVEDKESKKHKKKDLYRALIQSGEGEDEDEAEEGEDMEVTFNTGLEDISKRILEKRDQNEETVWQAYLRKRNEKKKARRNKSNDSSGDDFSDADHEPVEEPGDFFVEEPSVKANKEDVQGKSSSKRKKNKEAVHLGEAAEASRAELELLLADDEATDTKLKGYNLKRKKYEGKKGKGLTDEEKIPTVEYNDPRFSLFFTSPHFALDPTDVQFKRSAAYARQMAQKKQKKDDRDGSGRKAPAEMHKQTDEAVHNEPIRPDVVSSKKEKSELLSLVRSHRMKAKQVPSAIKL